MIPIERHQRILALVEQRGAVSINELTEILGVSHMTIRRDVSKLEEQGLLVSVSGGVRAVSRLAAEPSHLVKSTLQSEEKQAIGALAASHIAKNSCIYLDAGTTTLALARAILDRNDLQVVTNDFEITQLLIDASQCGVIHTGGTLCREKTAPAWANRRRVRYATWLSIRPLSPPAAGTVAGYSPLMRTRLPSRRPSARSAREASCCATVRNTIRWPRLWRYL